MCEINNVLNYFIISILFPFGFISNDVNVFIIHYLQEAERKLQPLAVSISAGVGHLSEGAISPVYRSRQSHVH